MPNEFDPTQLGTPNRGTSEGSLDQWNRAMRASPVYQSFMQGRGLPTDGRVQLSRQQQSALEQALRTAGFNIPSGMHIDQGGNLNQKNRLVRNAAIGAAAVGGAGLGLGLAGVGPLSGLGASGAGGAAGSGGALSGEMPWALTPYAGTASMSAPGVGAAAGGALGSGSGLFGGSQAVAFGSELPATGFAPSAYPAGVAAHGTGAAGGTVGAGALGAAGAAAAGEGAKSFLGLTPRDWMALAGSGLGTVGALTADNPNTNLNTSTTDPQMKELLDLMMGRLRKSEPLHDSILAMADGLLPTQYQRGGSSRG